MKKAMIIGATSGIGLEMAKILAEEGYILGLTGRRTELLHRIEQQLPTEVHTAQMDVTDTIGAKECFFRLWEGMGGADFVLLSAGTGYINPTLEWKLERETIETNVMGIASLMNAAYHKFEEVGNGHLAAITSIGGLRGSAESPSYNASKAFLINYLEGLRCKLHKAGSDIVVSDIRPGLVDTDMAKGEDLMFVMPVDVTARQIWKKLRRRREVISVTKRWKWLGFFIKHMPNKLYYKF